MNTIIGELGKSKKFVDLVKQIESKKSPVAISGLTDVGMIQILAGIKEYVKKPILFVTYNEIQAKQIISNIENFEQDNIFHFPKKEIVTYSYEAESKDVLYERMDTLNKIKDKKSLITITTIEALMQKLPSKDLLYKDSLNFKVGETYNLEDVKQKLVNMGYTRCDLIEGRGQFSVRGGILDVSSNDKKGIRIEFWGDEVDSIRNFDIISQRSTNALETVKIYPSYEFESEDNTNTLIDYLNENYLIIFDEIGKIKSREKNILNDIKNITKNLIEKEREVPQALLNMSALDIEEILEKQQVIYFEKNDKINSIQAEKYNFEYREINYYKSEIPNLITDLQKWQNEKKNVYVMVSTKEKAKKLREILEKEDIICKIEEKLNQTIIVKSRENIVTITVGNLTNGFENFEIQQIVISAEELISGEKKKRRFASKAYQEGEKVVFADLKTGDYVVHQNYGIGIFAGVNTIRADGTIKDYIKIKYLNDDILYIPTSQLDTIRKYAGGEEIKPQINKIGGKDWIKTKERVKNNLRAVAKELIELYAKREKSKGYAFSKDTPWQEQFENNFPYQETDDQLRCIEEVKKDMESQKPMDRLLCGDVGYGKTEVAIRAAFKAVMDQKQVAYLVPTTVLAQQQYEEFKKRMEEFPIKVEILNRFKHSRYIKNVIKKLELGEVDVVIGTHRLLSDDVRFKDLGLLIIDEEQRFGVKAKEKIKEYKTNVDVLTMTATPIPRTLHMSIVGIRDMSIIHEPPQDRKPVQTYVLEYDEEVIKEAITKELERDGQVFYIFNNVADIERKANQISRLVPEAEVSFAHGQMSGSKIEEIMQDFVDKKSNVLVCTTILESGIDIPNANTIIVENADRMGLAALYQIRGRVGRSNRQAYAYITYRRDKMLTELSSKRLRAIKEFTEFGSGFKIAMRDLEIRGAGSLLGEIQSGHLEQVGYDTYCQLLDEVIKEMKGIEVEPEVDIQIDLNVTSYIPDDYIEDSSQKIEIYQDIALCKNDNDIGEVVDEIIDRFGNMPKELENLLNIAKIKYLAKPYFISKISSKRTSVVFAFEHGKAEIDVAKLVKMYGNKIKFSPGVKDIITIQLETADERTILKETIKFLEEGLCK